MKSELENAVTHKALRDMAGFRAFRDGHQYCERGQVYGLTHDDQSITAKVLGLYEYQTKLWVGEGYLGYSCTCPLGQGESLCKHAVAVGLAWLEGREKTDTAPVIGSTEVETEKTLLTFLSTQERSQLVDLLMQYAGEDRRLFTRLLFRSTRLRDRTIDQKRFRQYIDRTLENGIAAGSYAESLETLANALSDVIKEGFAPEACTFTEYTFARLEQIAEPLTKEDEQILAGLDRLQDIHLRVCRVVRPSPEELARKLLAWRLNPKWDIFRDAVAAYADILGPDGQKAYLTLAEEMWAQEPDLAPGDPIPERFGRRFRLAYIIEAAANQTDDLDALVAIRRKDLTQPSSFLNIAELYKKMGVDDQAFLWAERGLDAFPGRPDPRLRDFLVLEYQAHGRHEEAAKLLRNNG